MIKRSAIIKHLKEKNLYEKIDEIFVDTLMQGIAICNEAAEQMQKDRGAMTDKSRDENKTVVQVTQAPGLYATGLNIIIKSARQLGIGPRARYELKLLERGDDDDGFNAKRK